MKKRILAAILAVAMLVGVCTVVVSAEDALTPIFEENFEGDTLLISQVNGSGTFEVYDDAGNKVWKITGGNSDFVTSYLIDEVDPSAEYTVSLRILGDCGITCVGDYTEPWQFYVDNGVNTGWGAVKAEWTQYIWKVSGKTRYSLGGQVQNDFPVMGNTIYIDDIKVYEGDKVDEVKAEIEAAKPTPTPENNTPTDPNATNAPVDPNKTTAPGTTATPSVSATPAPSASATPAPSASATATVDTGKTDDNGTTTKKSIKFKKKKVTIKKGKKATLKVTIKGAKKAKFSVNKKGKKIVKLSKKKAKSVVVKGKKKGKATITAKAAGKKAKCKVTVK